MTRRILLIDDDGDVREVAAVTLELMGGFEVFTAGSGAEGLVLAAAHQPDAILLDVMMPGLDGPATFKRLREAPETAPIPVILLTAKSHPRELEALGVDGVLAKPFDPMTLSQQLAFLLGW